MRFHTVFALFFACAVMLVSVGTYRMLFGGREEGEAVFAALPEETKEEMLARAAYAIAGEEEDGGGYLASLLICRILLLRTEDPSESLAGLIAPYLSDSDAASRYVGEPGEGARAAAKDALDDFCPFPEVTFFLRAEEPPLPDRDEIVRIGGFVFYK